MEDDLNSLGKSKTSSTFEANGRRPQLFLMQMEDNLNFILKLAPALSELGTAQPQLVHLFFSMLPSRLSNLPSKSLKQKPHVVFNLSLTTSTETKLIKALY